MEKDWDFALKILPEFLSILYFYIPLSYKMLYLTPVLWAWLVSVLVLIPLESDTEMRFYMQKIE